MRTSDQVDRIIEAVDAAGSPPSSIPRHVANRAHARCANRAIAETLHDQLEWASQTRAAIAQLLELLEDAPRRAASNDVDARALERRLAKLAPSPPQAAEVEMVRVDGDLLDRAAAALDRLRRAVPAVRAEIELDVGQRLQAAGLTQREASRSMGRSAAFLAVAKHEKRKRAGDRKRRP